MPETSSSNTDAPRKARGTALGRPFVLVKRDRWTRAPMRNHTPLAELQTKNKKCVRVCACLCTCVDSFDAKSHVLGKSRQRAVAALCALVAWGVVGWGRASPPTTRPRSGFPAMAMQPPPL